MTCQPAAPADQLLLDKLARLLVHANRTAAGRGFTIIIHCDAEGNVALWLGQPAGLANITVEKQKSML